MLQFGNSDKVIIVIEGYNDIEGGVLSLDVEAGTITRLSTGEVLDFSMDRIGFCNRPEMVKVESETDPKKEYTVYKTTHDWRTWICTCPDFEHRRSNEPRGCKHIGWVLGYGYRQVDKDGDPVNSHRTLFGKLRP